ncbi:hypothetical protein U3516DRAFT_779424 [Neocallimastix sp. 'constans']
MNPTTYDMNLVIYDIVYNDTTEYSVTNNYYENATNKVQGKDSIGATTGVIVADSSSKRASLTHKFIHKSKCLMIQQELHKSVNYKKNLTSGCLFKVWGSVTGTGADAYKNQANYICQNISADYTPTENNLAKIGNYKTNNNTEAATQT